MKPSLSHASTISYDSIVKNNVTGYREKFKFLSVQNLHTKVATRRCKFWLLVHQENKINKDQSKGDIICQGIDKSDISHW